MAIQNNEGFGLHLTLDGYGCQKEKLADKKLVRRVLLTLPSQLQMQIISKPQVLWYSGLIPQDCGVSGIIMIAESHISIHTFSQKEFLTADVYSCKVFDTDKTIEFFKKIFKPKELEINIIKRGLKFPKTAVEKQPSIQLQIPPL